MNAKEAIKGYWKARNTYKGTKYEEDYRRLSKVDECLVWHIYKLKKEIRKLAKENKQLKNDLQFEREMHHDDTSHYIHLLYDDDYYDD